MKTGHRDRKTAHSEGNRKMDAHPGQEKGGEGRLSTDGSGEKRRFSTQHHYVKNEGREN